MRLLGDAVLAHELGVLQDDAALLVLAWEGPPASAKLESKQAPVKLHS